MARGYNARYALVAQLDRVSGLELKGGGHDKFAGKQIWTLPQAASPVGPLAMDGQRSIPPGKKTFTTHYFLVKSSNFGRCNFISGSKEV